MNSSIFKAYDIRGKYPEEINEKIVSEIAANLANFFGPKTKIIIARDNRLSSPRLYRAAINGIKYKVASSKVIEIGLATTPMFYFLVNKLKADLGIMVTASHNPKEYNGLKIVGKNAVPISGNELHKNLR